MRYVVALSWLAMVLSALPAIAAPALVTILDCNFDAKTVDAPIGEGGAAAGEPVSRGEVPAFVRAQPFPTPSLELTEDWGFGARAVRFGFLQDAAVSSGTLRLSFQLYVPPERNNFAFYVRELNFSAVSFLNLRFSADGELFLQDLNDPGARFLTTYPTGTAIPFEITWDLDQRTYDVTISGTELLNDEPLGPIPTGIGGILLGPDHDEDSAGTIHLDDLKVEASSVPQPVRGTTWSALKSSGPPAR